MDYLLLKIILTGETIPSHMLIFLRTGVSFIQQCALPQEIDAPLGETFFFLQHMIYRHTLFKTEMGLVGASKDALSFVLIDQSLRHDLNPGVCLKPD